MKKAIFLVFTSLLLLFAVHLNGQDTLQTGKIEGKVTDDQGLALPGVDVVIESDTLIQGTRSTVTSAEGTYRFPRLPIGEYKVTFKLTGFKTLIKENVEVAIRKTTTVNTSLEIGAIEEEITVIGEAPVVDTKSTTVGTNFTTPMLQKIPTARDPWVILQQTPGMVMDRENIGGSESGQQSDGYVHGSLGNQTGYYIDGVNMTDPSDLSSMMYYDFDSFDEIQIETGSHEADVQVGGVVINMVTKSGGNKFSGGVNFYYEDENLQTNNIPEDDPTYEGAGFGNPMHYLYDYGFDLGGPIVKDKLWFYGAFRRTEIDRYIIGYELDGEPQKEYTDLIHGTFKLTWQTSKNNKLLGWVNLDRKAKPHRSAGPTRPPVTTEFQDSTSPFYHLEDTWTVNPNLILNFKAGISNMWYQRAPQDEVNMDQPAIRIYYSEPFRRMYENAYYIYRWYYHDRYQFQTSANYFKDDFLGSDHELKVGFEYQNAPYHTTRKHPGDTLIYWDYPDHTSPWEVWTFRDEKWDQTNEVFSAYIQDSISIGDTLTFNLGLRYDGTRCHVNETHVDGNQWTEYYEQRFGTPVALTTPEKKNVVVWNVLSPRLGMTFDLFGDDTTILKASFARYSQQTGYYPAEYAVETGYFDVDYRWYDDNGDGIPQTDEFGYVTYHNVGQTVDIDQDLKSPYTNEVTLGVERRITNDLGVSLNYHYKQNKRFMWTDNLALDPERDYTPVTAQDPGPDGELGTADDGGTITVYNLDEAKIDVFEPFITNRPGYMTYYSGVELVLRKRFTNKWQFMGSITYGTNKRKIPLESVDDPNNREMNHDTPTSVDSPLIIKCSGSYELPFGIAFAGSLGYRTGYPTQRWFRYYGLNQGRINVDAEKYGSGRYPDLVNLDLRLSKSFKLRDWGSIEAMLDLFNVFNHATILSWDAESWSGFHNVREVLAPRIARLGIKFNF
ncbi:MAG: TonB-dependent receptor [Acidobacteriota bacterium]